MVDWAAFKSYKPPDPNKYMGIGPVNWDAIAMNIAIAKENGDIAAGGLRHGHTFLQLCDIRGYQNIIYDMADDDPRLRKLIVMIYTSRRLFSND